MCTIFGLSALSSLGLVALGAGVAGVSIVHLFKLGLAKFKAKYFPPKDPAA